jgi:hypothetical protein
MTINTITSNIMILSTMTLIASTLRIKKFSLNTLIAQ